MTDREFTATLGTWSCPFYAPDANHARVSAIRAYREEVGKNLPRGAVQASMHIRATKSWSIKAAEISLKEVLATDLQYFVGFWEGDGSVNRTNRGRGVQIALYQKDADILTYFKDLFHLPERILQRKWQHVSRGASGITHQLLISREAHVQPLLNLLSEYVVCPNRVAQLQRYVRAGLPVVEHEPTWPWLAGFIDAEGCVYNDGYTIILTLTQKDTRVLQKIRTYVGRGSIPPSSPSTLQLIGQHAWPVLEQIYPYMHLLAKREKIYASKMYFDKVGLK